MSYWWKVNRVDRLIGCMCESGGRGVGILSSPPGSKIRPIIGLVVLGSVGFVNGFFITYWGMCVTCWIIVTCCGFCYRVR